jgi:hypothetical protein
MRLASRCALQGLNYHLFHFRIADLPRRTRARFIIEAFQSASPEAKSPLADHPQGTAQLPGNRFVIQSFGAGQHHAGAPREEGLTARAMGERLQAIPFLFGEDQGLFGASGAHSKVSFMLDAHLFT